LAARHTVAMPLDAAHLSSLATALDDITARITAIADDLSGAPREDVAADLYEIERHLKAATRRLHTLLTRL
jgi:hypothetical protein